MPDPLHAEIESHRREVGGEGTEDICKAEGITASNCWVIPHRARIASRACPARAGSGGKWLVPKSEFNCREASRLLSLAYERPLSPHGLGLLRRHLDACLMCRNFDSQLRLLHQAARRYRAQ